MSLCNVMAVPGSEGLKCWVHDEPVLEATDQACPKNGQPASPMPLHVMDQPDRKDRVNGARMITAGSRPIVVHMGYEGQPGHITGMGECWCGPVVIPSG